MIIPMMQAVLTFALVIFLLLPLRSLETSKQLLILLALMGLALIPVKGIALAIYVRSIVDDLSISATAALTVAALVRMRLVTGPDRLQQRELLICFAALALLLYPAALGATFFDPYRLGYSPRFLIAAIGCITLFFLMRSNLTGAAILSLATLAFSLELKGSENYWDYLIDPAIGIYCIAVLLLQIAKRFIPVRYRRA